MEVKEFTKAEDPSIPPSEENHYFQDENIKVFPIIVLEKEERSDYLSPLPPSPFEYKKANTEMESLITHCQFANDRSDRDREDDCDKHLEDDEKNEEKKFRKEMERKYKPEGISTAVICYAFHTPDVPGKFNREKAIALGIPPGPLFGSPFPFLFSSPSSIFDLPS